jgi:putative membrane protein
MPEHTLRALFEVVVFSVVGIVVFALAFFVIARVSPFSLRKEIEEDQNTALSVVIGSMIIGLSLIISAAIHG